MKYLVILTLLFSSISNASLLYPGTIKGTLVKMEGDKVFLDQGDGRIIEVPKKFIKDPLVPRAMIYVKVKDDKEFAQIKSTKKK